MMFFDVVEGWTILLLGSSVKLVCMSERPL